MSMYTLKKGVAGLSDLKDGKAASLLATAGTFFWIDPVNGNDGNSGKAPDNAFKTLAVAYAALTANKNDVLFFLGGATALTPAATITWAKDFTHFVGVSAPLPGMGQRCRIVNSGSADLATLFEVSADGCIFQNLQWYDGKSKAEVGQNVLVSGDRNYFGNCFFAGMGDATAGSPFAVADSYSLKVSGSENCFEDCTVGLDTTARTAANYELWVAGPRNRFVHCDFRSNSTTAGKFLVKIDNSAADLRDTIFDSCLFFNYTENWAGGINDAFDMPAGGLTHWVILRGDCQIVGLVNAANATTTWGDTYSRIYGAGPAPNAGYGISITPTS